MQWVRIWKWTWMPFSSTVTYGSKRENKYHTISESASNIYTMDEIRRSLILVLNCCEFKKGSLKYSALESEIFSLHWLNGRWWKVLTWMKLNIYNLFESLLNRMFDILFCQEWIKFKHKFIFYCCYERSVELQTINNYFNNFP